MANKAPASKKKVDALLQTIKQSRASGASGTDALSGVEPGPETPATPRRQAGKFSSIYLNEQDQRLLRELSVWFAAQGLRINDTLVLRAALRAARPGSDLLAAYEESLKADRRYKETR